MPIQIALAWSKESEAELIEKGFRKREVYVKPTCLPGTSKEAEEAGDRDFFKVRHVPFQFVTTSWWGAGPD